MSCYQQQGKFSVDKPPGGTCLTSTSVNMALRVNMGHKWVIWVNLPSHRYVPTTEQEIIRLVFCHSPTYSVTVKLSVSLTCNVFSLVQLK